ISSFGRNISPEWVEGELLAESVILQAIVVGDGRPFCVALLMPLDSSTSDLYLQVAVDAANTRLPDYARVRSWVRLGAPLSAAQDLLTANGRPRRDLIEAHFGAVIERCYHSSRELLTV
ncbi:MAG TPA: long-chain fatty acid--CoA ligase, partial [Kineobactrum sp.]